MDIVDESFALHISFVSPTVRQKVRNLKRLHFMAMLQLSTPRKVTLHYARRLRYAPLGVLSTPALTIEAVAFFLNSLIAPKKPSSPVVFGLASHSSSCLRKPFNQLSMQLDIHYGVTGYFRVGFGTYVKMRLEDGSTWKVTNELMSFSTPVTLAV